MSTTIHALRRRGSPVVDPFFTLSSVLTLLGCFHLPPTLPQANMKNCLVGLVTGAPRRAHVAKINSAGRPIDSDLIGFAAPFDQSTKCRSTRLSAPCLSHS